MVLTFHVVRPSLDAQSVQHEIYSRKALSAGRDFLHYLSPTRAAISYPGMGKFVRSAELQFDGTSGTAKRNADSAHHFGAGGNLPHPILWVPDYQAAESMKVPCTVNNAPNRCSCLRLRWHCGAWGLSPRAAARLDSDTHLDRICGGSPLRIHYVASDRPSRARISAKRTSPRAMSKYGATLRYRSDSRCVSYASSSRS